MSSGKDFNRSLSAPVGFKIHIKWVRYEFMWLLVRKKSVGVVAAVQRRPNVPPSGLFVTPTLKYTRPWSTLFRVFFHRRGTLFVDLLFLSGNERRVTQKLNCQLLFRKIWKGISYPAFFSPASWPGTSRFIPPTLPSSLLPTSGISYYTNKKAKKLKYPFLCTKHCRNVFWFLY